MAQYNLLKMHFGRGGSFLLSVVSVIALSACYMGAQRASQVALTPAIDTEDNMPSSDLSFAADYYEMTGGFIVGKFDIFSGAGISATPRVHIRAGQSISSTDDLPFARAHVGVGWEALVVNDFAVRVFGLLATDPTSLMFEETHDSELSTVDSVIISSKEVGIQFSTVTNRDVHPGRYFEPVIRLGFASQSGRARGNTFPEGFSAKALVVTLGLNMFIMGSE